MSVASSTATAVIGEAELERGRHARPAPRHQRPENVSSVIAPGGAVGGFLGDSPTAYREGGQQDLWLNDAEDDELTPRSGRLAASVAGSERTQVLVSKPGCLKEAAAQGEVKPKHMLRDAEGCDAPETAAVDDSGLSHPTHRGAAGSDAAQRSQLPETHREQLRALQLKLERAAAPQTAGTDRSFRTEYSDDLGSVRSGDLMPSPKSGRAAIAGADSTYNVKGAAATWAAGLGHEDGSEAGSHMESAAAAKARRKQRAQERVAGGGKTIAALPRRDSADTWGASSRAGGSRPASAGSAVSRGLIDDDVFEDSDEEHYDEGHVGIMKRQDQILAENMALVMGAGEERGGGGDDMLLDDEGAGADADPGKELAAAAPPRGGLSQEPRTGTEKEEEEEEEEEEELDPLMAEMRRKARLRAQRARAQEKAEVVPAISGPPDSRPRELDGQGSPADTRPTAGMSQGQQKVGEESRGGRPDAGGGGGDVQGRSSNRVMPGTAGQPTLPEVGDERTPRLHASPAMRRREAAGGAARMQDDAVPLGKGATASKDEGAPPPPECKAALPARQAELDPEGRPFSPDLHAGTRKAASGEHVPLVRLERRPFSASTQMSRDPSPTPRVADGLGGSVDALASSPSPVAPSAAGSRHATSYEPVSTGSQTRASTPSSARSWEGGISARSDAGDPMKRDVASAGGDVHVSKLALSDDAAGSWIGENAQVD